MGISFGMSLTLSGGFYVSLVPTKLFLFKQADGLRKDLKYANHSGWKVIINFRYCCCERIQIRITILGAYKSNFAIF